VHISFERWESICLPAQALSDSILKPEVQISLISRSRAMLTGKIRPNDDKLIILERCNHSFALIRLRMKSLHSVLIALRAADAADHAAADAADAAAADADRADRAADAADRAADHADHAADRAADAADHAADAADRADSAADSLTLVGFRNHSLAASIASRGRLSSG
jgi:hypothetical protein